MEEVVEAIKDEQEEQENINIYNSNNCHIIIHTTLGQIFLSLFIKRNDNPKLKLH